MRSILKASVTALAATAALTGGAYAGAHALSGDLKIFLCARFQIGELRLQVSDGMGDLPGVGIGAHARLFQLFYLLQARCTNAL